MNLRTSPRLALIAGATILALGLTGCARDQFLDNPEPPPETPTQTTEPLAQPTVAPPADEDEPSGEIGTDFSREQLEQLQESTVDCDGDNTTVTGDNSEVIRLRGNCAGVTVESNGLRVLVDNVDTITVNAHSVVVYALSADRVEFDGDKNVVSWTDGDRPSIENDGDDNEVRQETQG